MKLTTINIKNAYHTDLFFTFGGYTFKATDVRQLPVPEVFVVLDVNEFPALIHEDQIEEFTKLSQSVLNNAVRNYLKRMQEVKADTVASSPSSPSSQPNTIQVGTEPIE